LDAKLHGFMDLNITGIADEAGDTAFDEEEYMEASLPGIQVIAM